MVEAAACPRFDRLQVIVAGVGEVVVPELAHWLSDRATVGCPLTLSADDLVTVTLLSRLYGHTGMVALKALVVVVEKLSPSAVTDW